MPAPETHLEVERTFLADTATGLPDLVVGPVAEVREVDELTLSATYHDTEDLRLVHAGVTMRRRDGGDDDGWQVKVGTGRARLELRRPPTRTERVPVGVRRLVRGVVRTAPLTPVAEVRTQRRRVHLLGESGAVLAEVARDRVVATRLVDGAEEDWHEIEVELVEGDLQLLDEVARRLVAHGAVESDVPSKLRRALGDLVPATAPTLTKKSTAGEVLHAYLVEVHGRLLRYDVRLRADQPDAVHRMRTTLRRLRSALAAYRRLFRSGATSSVEDGLRWWGRELSVSRDLQVVDGLLADAEDPESPWHADPTAVRRVRRELAERRRTRAATVAELLDSDDYLALLDDLADLVEAPPFRGRAARSAKRELRRGVQRAHKRVSGRWPGAFVGASADAAHDVRKAVKRLRFACEVAEPVLGKDARRLRQRAKALSATLGDRQDALLLQRTLAELLPSLGTSAAARDAGFELGRLQAQQDVRIRQLMEQADADLERLGSSKASDWLD